MSFFAKVTPPPQPKTKNIISISYLAVGVIAVMVLSQLFMFESFPALISSLWLPGGEVAAKLLAAVIVIFEVLALPFLLSMHLSRGFRIVSMVMGWSVVLIWLTLSTWENLMAGTISASGLFGATIPLPVGWWNVLFSLALGVLVAWASWGMWPIERKKKKRVVQKPSKA